MKDVTEILIPWAVVTLALFALVDRDEARLSDAERQRGWPPASRTLALVYFGAISLPIHFWRTRRSWKGFGLGLLWLALVIALDEAVSLATDALPDAVQAPLLVVALAGFTAAMIRRAVRARRRFEGPELG